MAAKLGEVLRLKEELQNKSNLSFTLQEEKDRRLAFLDCFDERMQDRFLTSVHIKDTKTGDCNNYKGICPERYKSGIIKIFLHRSYHISSTPDLFQLEVTRIKQLFTKDNFPMKLIDKTVQKFIES